ncbi:N5-glutamine methyltransferase family protein [Rathayibacter tanaceti]|uniref:Methyltransferase n=2 Tax=Rathayibacter tanaceti TaxID=1671680 RepID=A0A166IPS2_9MICO|nr:HemK/PrmC family methyltransferase [Rathayibacter tanaceti]KZX22726.1 50S ribosomal protein L3 glutamine methyltransferase [Rathayibacter tanaceti]QHC55914.1 methyltransferase [Rathayibacter tanaceti]TCO39253.1 release factor glutamine methyltransferase [Rathayibacter tanaceti]
MTVARATLQREVTRRLTRAGVWDPEGDARALLDRFLGPDDAASAQAELERAVAEREERIPLEHIVGMALVDGATYTVGTGAFIPRAESTRIIELAAAPEILRRGGAVLDLCAGVGTLGIGIALRRPDARVTLIERDEVPMRYLRRNIARLLGSERSSVTAVQADLYETDARGLAPADVVVANAPYVPQDLRLLPEWAEHQPREALYGGGDGLDLIRRAVEVARTVLPAQGTLLLEHDRAQPEAVRALLEAQGFAEVQTVLDSAGETRITRAARR